MLGSNLLKFEENHMQSPAIAPAQEHRALYVL